MWVQTGAYHLASLWWLIAIVVVFIIAIIALSLAGRAMALARAGGVASRGVGQAGAPGTGPETQKQAESLRMLDERYAKGEISREEYMQRQTDLQSKI